MTNERRAGRHGSPTSESDPVRAALREAVDAEPGRILSVLIRFLGDIDLAEDALQDAVAAALEHWPSAGVPRNPGGWLVTTARRSAIDRLRRSSTWARKEEELRVLQELDAAATEPQAEGDDRLRLIFTCSHPALPLDALVALVATPVIALNRAVAHGMAYGPARGLEMIDEIDGLGEYHLLHAARADLLRRLGRHAEASAAYRDALRFASRPTDREYLSRRLQECARA